jgi:putative addiction module component (TIGR02574 family)
MARGLERIEEEIRSLSPAEKVVLLRTLIAELDAPADPDVDRAWLEEAQRRHRELAEGKVKGVSGERVFENLKSRLQWEPEARLSRRVPGQ